MESFGQSNLGGPVKQTADSHSTLREILRPMTSTSDHEKITNEMYPTSETIAQRVSYAKRAFSDARKVAIKADLEMPKETSMAQVYAELGLLTSIGAGEAVAAFVKKEQN